MQVVVYVAAFLLYFSVFITQIWRFVGASISPGLGIHDIAWQRAAGDSTAALQAIAGVLVVFIWVIGRRTHFLLIFAVAAVFGTSVLVQTAITGADMCMLAHGTIGYTQVGLDYAILSADVLFLSLICSYNLRWRPERSMLDPAGGDVSYAAMPPPGDELNDVPLNGAASEDLLPRNH